MTGKTRRLTLALLAPLLAITMLAVVATPPAAAGTADDPEIQDEAGDQEPTGIDVTMAWFEPVANGVFEIHVARDDGFPAQPVCLYPGDEMYVNVSFDVVDASGETPSNEPRPDYPYFAAIVYTDCLFFSEWTFWLAKWSQDELTQQYAGGDVLDDVPGETRDGVVVMTLDATDLGFPSRNVAFELRDTYIFSHRGPFSPYAGDTIVTEPAANDRGPDDGFGRSFTMVAAAPPAAENATSEEDNAAVAAVDEPGAPALSFAWSVVALTVVLWAIGFRRLSRRP